MSLPRLLRVTWAGDAPTVGSSKPLLGASGRAIIVLFVGFAFLVGIASGALGRFQNSGALVVGALGLVSVVYSIRKNRPSLAWPWWAISCALFLFLAAGVVRSELHTLGNLTRTRSLVPDFIDLPGYVALAAGLLGFSFARAKERKRPLGIALDGAIAALALWAVAWVYIVEPLLSRQMAPLAARAVLACYPAMSIFMVVVTFRIAFSPDQGRHISYWALLMAMTWMFIGDALYMFAELGQIHPNDRFLDLPYVLAYLAAAVLALHPSMTELTEPAPIPRPRPAAARVVLVALCLLIPVLLVLQHPNEVPGDRLALLVIVSLLAGAVVLRIVQALLRAERSEARMAHQAAHDALTGMPNRRRAQEHLASLLHSPQVAASSRVTLLFIDLDRFKIVNDTLGHTLGDQLLVAVGERLQDCARPSGFVSRIGGDEFTVALPGIPGMTDAIALADRVRTCLNDPFVIDGAVIHISASVGIAIAEPDAPRGRRRLAPSRSRHCDVPSQERRAGHGRNLRRINAIGNLRAL